MEEDRISQLPDEILQHIISLIDIEKAVETSILGKRWKNLWLSLSDLNFNFNFRSHAKLKDLVEHILSDLKSHEEFVENFLSRRDHTSTIRKFHLSYRSECNYFGNDSHAEFVEKCAAYAINHGVTDLHLDALYRRVFRGAYRDAFVACKTLRELKLTRCGNAIDLPKWFSLPHLKTLHLEHSNFLNDGFLNNDEFLKGPFSGFSELEKLTLTRCRIKGLVIFCPKLRYLEIIRCSSDFFRNGPVLEEISTPELTSFRYEAYYPLPQCSKANNFPMLEEAYLDIKLSWYRIIEDNELTSKCMRLLHQLGNAKIVALSLDMIKAIEMNGGDYIKRNPSSPLFPNIKCLKLMKGCLEIPNVRRSVMNYLTKRSLYGDSVIVELPEGVSVSKMEDLLDRG